MTKLPILNCFLIQLFASLHAVTSLSVHPKLLLISFDGFRYDSLNETLVPNIYDFARRGTWFINGVKPQFVTFTSTNHMGMVTGLHAEGHGIVSNVFYEDVSYNLFDYYNIKEASVSLDTSERNEWYHGEPIWATNEKAHISRRSACLYWPYADSPFPNSMRPTMYKKWERFRDLEEWKDDVHTIIQLFTREEDPVNFVAWYIAQPDHALHTNGFYNGVYVEIMKQLDDLFGYFMHHYTESDLNSEVNVILTSDHGHAQIEGTNNIMCVGDYIDLSKVFYGEHMIYLRDKSIFDEVLQNLTEAIKRNSFKVTIYTKSNLPSSFHYMGMPSVIGDIILSPDVGAQVRFDCKKRIYDRIYDYGRKMLNSSTHGMEPHNPEMRPILALYGPDIVEKQVMSNIPNIIDLYALMNMLLRTEPAPSNASITPFVDTVHYRGYGTTYYGEMSLWFILFLSILASLTILCNLILWISSSTQTRSFKMYAYSMSTSEESAV